MQQSRGPEVPDLSRTISRSRSRSTSLSSDSQLSRIHFLTPSPINPPPSFIAPSAASQIITADQEFNAADFLDEEDEGEDDAGASALVTPEALSALNGFLDHLLFNILAAAKSTRLASIRPAVAEVLKRRLAKEVVSVADDELSEYLGGPEDEQVEFYGDQNPDAEFDLIRSWKVTRLRCMVYTRLGDMEEDDEEEYILQEGLGDSDGVPRRFVSHAGNITPAAAIFLTSIIEHLGEQALVIAGETARSRLSSRIVDEQDESIEDVTGRGSMSRLVVEDLDMEKLALNPTLGRLWRTWRKCTRAPLSRMASRESIMRRGTIGSTLHSRKSSVSLTDEFFSQKTSSPPPLDRQPEIDPTSIPLPMSENDVYEIEHPNLSLDIEGGEIQTMEAVVAHKVRPRSLMVLTLPSPKSPSSLSSSPVTPKPRASPSSRHGRSQSLPSAPSPADTSDAEQNTERAVSLEERRRLETMYEHEEEEVMEEEKSDATNDESLIQVAGSPREPEDQALQSDKFEAVVESGIAHETPARSSLSAASVEVAVSPTSSSTTVSSTILIDRDDEDIEEPGMCDESIPTSIQRSKRRSSRDSLHADERFANNISIADERMAEAAIEDPQSMHKQKVSTMQHLVNQNVPIEPDANLSTKETLPPPSIDSTLEKGPRPDSTSGESVRSDRSRTFSRPSPLVLTNSTQHLPGASASSSATERAAVQRLSGRPSTSRASSTYSKPRRSDSFSSYREKRPVTAGSTTSQVSTKLKGLISRPADSSSLRLRSSSEISRVSANTGDTMHDDKSGLDELIRSEETILYTLTPKSVREMEFPDSPLRKTPRSTTAELAESLKNFRPEDPAWPRRSTSSSLPRSPEPPLQSPVHSTRFPKSKVGQARDARPSLESSSDFAQFIRSSGPDGPLSARSGLSSFPKSPTGRRLSDTTELSKQSPRAGSAMSGSTRSTKLQARPAAIPTGEGTSDLIDFIREGPPTIGAHRIPRTVAPFRSTMDSEDLAFEQGAPSITSTQDELMTTKSQVSLGSRTGLLESSNRVNIQAGPTRMIPNSSRMNQNEDLRPKRTQRRVPDPYAIDIDDDDELEELLQEPTKPRREEESLIDFLRNVPPPESESQPRPFVTTAATAKSSTSGFGSASAMKARLLRNTSFERAPSSKPSKTSLRQQSGQYSNGASNYMVKVGMERNTGTIKPMPFVSEGQTETSALADFLRNTGPPEPPPSRPLPPTKDSSLSRLFVRRKKVEV